MAFISINRRHTVAENLETLTQRAVRGSRVCVFLRRRIISVHRKHTDYTIKYVSAFVYTSENKKLSACVCSPDSKRTRSTQKKREWRIAHIDRSQPRPAATPPTHAGMRAKARTHTRGAHAFRGSKRKIISREQPCTPARSLSLAPT